MRETEIEGDASHFFLGQSVRVGASERLDQRALAMINMPGGGDDEMACTHAFQLRIVCGAGGANGVDDRVVLMRKDRAQIEFERFVPDITDDWRSECAQSTRKFVYRAVFRGDIDGHGGNCRSWQSPAADFDDAATNADLGGQTTQALNNGGGAGA